VIIKRSLILMSGLGKPRSKLGRWMDSRGIKQGWLIRKARVSKGTATSACGDKNYIPTGSTMKKILKALREIDPSVKADQFWDM
jgi:hypothetical protein